MVLDCCKWALLNPKGIIAADEAHILIVSVLLMLVVVIPVIILTFAFAWRYREGNAAADYQPNWSHSTLLEVVWWTIPCVIIAILATITWVSSHRLDPYKSLQANDQKEITIQVVAMQWKWLFIYPDENIATVNDVEIPVGTPVKFLITSDGLMNSFQIQQLAGQIYAMAGMQTKLSLIADEIGDYSGLSTNFSGKGFADMTFSVHVRSREDYDAWVKSVKQVPLALSSDAFNELSVPSIKNRAQYYSSAKKDIFLSVVMKNTVPGKEVKNLCSAI